MDTSIERPAGPGAAAGRGGEMGARIRAFDWASTSLGPLDRWPRALRLAVDLMLDSRFPIYIAWGADFVQLYNDACRGVFGPSKHPAALGRSTREVFAEIWGELVGPIFDRVMAEGEPTYLEDQLTPFDRNGFVEETYFTSCSSAIRTESGAVGGVLVTMMDTTERVLAERRLRTLRDLGAAALEAASPEAACATAAGILGRNALDVPFVALYLADERNAVARRGGLWGLPPDHAAAPPVVALGGGSGRGWPLAEVAAGRAARLVDDADLRSGGLDCGPWAESPGRALVVPLARAGEAQPVGLMVAGISARRPLDAGYRDFLELVAGHVTTAVHNAGAREAERRRVQALAELDRARTLFFSDVSHEFRTPLTLMLGPLEQLEEELGPALTPRARELIDTAQRSGRRLRKLVDTVLDFARIEAGGVEAVREPTDLAALTAGLAGMFRSAAERAGLRLRVDCPPLPGPAWVDPEMWEKIVLNLLSNALKFTFEGEVAVVLRARGDRVELAVRDTGVGIPEEHLPQLFQRFHRVRGARARSHEGSGIGLALVHELVRLHGGAVRVRSAVGAGTTLTVSLPRSAGAPPARSGAGRTSATPGTLAAASAEEAVHWTPPGGERAAEAPASADGARVLVVEDNADMRAYVTRILAARYRVEACADAGAALEAARRSRPDLVLSDVMMPGVDGVELVRALRATPSTSAVPLVLLSARAGEEATLEGLGAGADDYLVKPFSARELLARVEAQIARARLRIHAAAAEERGRISRDLHDSVTQTLIAATVQAEELAASSERSGDARAGEILELAHMTRAAMAEMRVLLAEMRPEFLERGRVGHLVRQLADAVRGRMRVTVVTRLEDPGSEALPVEVRVAVYRVAQESLNNVVKHSRARSVEVVLTAGADAVALRVRDDGVGFGPGAGTAGLGVPGMRERAAMIGAALTVGSRRGRGAEVELLWPAP